MCRLLCGPPPPPLSPVRLFVRMGLEWRAWRDGDTGGQRTIVTAGQAVKPFLPD